MKMKIGVLLSGCGVYDGVEIQEAVLTLLAIQEIGAEYVCIGVDKDQYHVVNHLTGEVSEEKRNMLVEAARIARGDIKDINSITPADIDGLVIPGGFGSAKNFTTWAFNGADSSILPEVKLLLVNLANVGTPIAALCVSPIVLAKAFEGSSIQPTLTIGTTEAPSPYDITSFNEGIKQTGSKIEMKSLGDISIDAEYRIITAPCYMMDATISEINSNIKIAIKALKELILSV